MGLSRHSARSIKFVGALTAVALIGTASVATPVLVNVGTSYTAGSPYTFTVDDSSFTFTGTGDIFNPTAISTSGGAKVNSFGGFLGIPITPTSSFTNRGTVEFGPSDPFTAFASPTTISYSNGRNYIGLSATVGADTYYGYAYTTDNKLNSYAFETVANKSIVATAAVPEPASWAMMIGGIGFLGGTMRRRRAVRSSVTFA